MSASQLGEAIGSDGEEYSLRLGRCDVGTDVVPDARRGCLHGFIGQVRIARGGLHLCVTQQSPDHRKALSEGQGAGRKGVAQVIQQSEDGQV